MKKRAKSDEKIKILELRKKGYGYKSIAGILKVNRDTVRNICKNNNLTGYGKPTKEAKIEIKQCQYCGKDINTEERKGRKAKFCSDKCRRTWWSENCKKKDKRESSWYSFKCQKCGKEFKAYGNKNRKFCSIKCASEYRFGSATQNE